MTVLFRRSRVIVSWLSLVGIGLAVPVGLALAGGNPLPSEIPSVSELTEALSRGSVSDRTVVKMLAGLCWVSWSQLVLAIGVEVHAQRRGRSLRVPVLPGFRGLAGVLLAGVTVSLQGSPSHPSEGPPPALPRIADLISEPPGPIATVHQATGDSDASGLVDDADAGSGAAEELRRRGHVVRPRETLWTIAEQHLGDGLRWREIHDLNVGRVQSDGGRVEPGDTLLRPGWVLTLPAEVTGDDRGDGTRLVVEEGDTLWDLAKRHLDDGTKWPEIYSQSRVLDQPNGGRLEDPHVIRPGWVLALPTTLESGPDAAGTSEDSAAPDVQSRDVEGATDEAGGDTSPGEDLGARRSEESASADHGDEGTEPPSRQRADDEPVTLEDEGATPPEAAPATGDPLDDFESPSEPSPRLELPAPDTWPDVSSPERVDDDPGPKDTPPRTAMQRTAADGNGDGLSHGFADHGLLAVGISRTISARRMSQERRRAAGERLALPSADARRAESAIRSSADHRLVEFAHVALRGFMGRRDEMGPDAPMPIAVVVGNEIALHFDEAQTGAPDDFRSAEGGAVWLTGPDRYASLATVGSSVWDPLPLFLTIGSMAGRQLLLNLDATRVVALTGSEDAVCGALFSAAVELSTSSWRSVDVICVGFGRELRGIAGIQLVDSIEELRELPCPVVTCPLHDPRGSRRADTAETTDPARPRVVLCDRSVDASHREWLMSAAAQRNACCTAVAAASTGVRVPWRVELSDECARLLPLDLSARPCSLPQGLRLALGELIADQALVTSSSSSHSQGVVGQVGRSRRRSPAPTEASPVEVRIIGTVEVVGATAPFRRRRPLELVVYLALHRRGAAPDVVTEALWPDRLVSPATLHAASSTARRCLGSNAEGEPLLPHIGSDGLYRVTDDVSVDYETFRELTEQAVSLDDEEGIEALRLALGLVRGRPFDVPGGEYIWAHAEALISAVTAEVADASHRLASLCLDRGDSRGAWWATRQGLLASPGNEQLHRDRMFAADVAGNPAGVEAVIDELCRSVEIDRDDMDGVLHPLTIEVYERLSRRPTRRLASGLA